MEMWAGLDKEDRVSTVVDLTMEEHVELVIKDGNAQTILAWKSRDVPASLQRLSFTIRSPDMCSSLSCVKCHRPGVSNST